MSALPVKFRWDGDAMVPATSFWSRKADEEFIVGQTYAMTPVGARSQQSHNHYFAVIADAWSNLPDELLEIYPTAEHLRKKALIRKGYRDEREHVCGSDAEAQRLAATIRPLDSYAIIETRGRVVRIWTAKSQSNAAMPGNGEFQASKADVLAFIDDLLGAERGTVEKHGGMAA